MHRFAACSAQGIGIAMLRRQQIAGCGKAMPEFFPGLATGAIGHRAMQKLFGLRPLLLMTRQARHRQQQARAIRILGEPTLRAGAA